MHRDLLASVQQRAGPSEQAPPPPDADADAPRGREPQPSLRRALQAIRLPASRSPSPSPPPLPPPPTITLAQPLAYDVSPRTAQQAEGARAAAQEEEQQRQQPQEEPQHAEGEMCGDVPCVLLDPELAVVHDPDAFGDPVGRDEVRPTAVSWVAWWRAADE